jgi:hypothetical protein
MKRTMPVVFMLFAVLRGKPTDILFADSTPYEICKIARKYGHKVFKGVAALSKNSIGWFYGLKLHILKNHFELEHTKLRSVTNALVHLISTLLAYCLKQINLQLSLTF